MKKLLKINPLDNVYVVCNCIFPNDVETINGIKIIFNQTLELGHKVAASPILKGEKIIKFGVSIGSATAEIQVGEHVHLHNLKSDYLSTYTLSNEFIKSK